MREISVLAGGVQGDFNRFRHEEIEDDPDSALLLLPVETLKQLNDEGWPVEPGHLGENVTTTGIPYDALRPGSRLVLGEVEAVISRACIPCAVLHGLPYAGADRGPGFVRSLLGRRGWYARVARPGRIRLHDPIWLRPPG